MRQPQRSAAVEALFPPGVVAFEFRGTASPSDLFPAELQCVSRAVEKRRGEFATGRLCARAALAVLGCESVPLLIGPDRMPVWPAGVVGSITHTEGYCVAVAAPATRYAAIGVDAERVVAMDPSVWTAVLRPEELAGLKDLDEIRQLQTTTVIFSAKEAFYKCQYPLTRRWVGFDEVVVKIAARSFQVSMVGMHALRGVSSEWDGRFMCGETLVVTGIAVEQHGDSK